MQSFEDIRPFFDSEVPLAISQLLNDKSFSHAIRQLRFPFIPQPLAPLLTPFVHWRLQQRLKRVQSLDDFQNKMLVYLDYMVASTINHLTVSGLERLNAKQRYLFISNHRDITLDPALINYFLYHRFKRSMRIAIGDNLLDNSFITTVMRLNKSFIVKRSQSSPKQMLSTSKQLSAYIHHCLHQDNHSVWLAQKAGRAKNGIDKTDVAIIKMLALNRNTTPFADYINQLNIVPVSISYQYDPCDVLKCQELFQLRTQTNYQKTLTQDHLSMARGILGFKGNVHVSFGQPIQGYFSQAQQIAQLIDTQIIGNYLLQSSNYLAYQQLHGQHAQWQESYSLKEQRIFMQRLACVPEHLKQDWLKLYANPVSSQLALAETQTTPM